MLSFFMDVLFGSLAFTFIFLNPLTEKVKLRYYALLFVLLFFFEAFQLGNHLSIALTVGFALFYMLILTKNRLLNAILALFSYFLVVVCNYFSLFLLQKIFSLNAEGILSSYFINTIFDICFVAIPFALTSLIGRYAKKYLNPDSFNRYQKLFSLVLIEVLLAVSVLIFNIDYGKQIGYPNNTIIYNCILFFLYFLLSTLLLLNVVKMTRKNMEAEQREIEYNHLLDYVKDLEQTSQSLRKFRHNYMNILLSMDILIQARDMDRLIPYFEAHIKPESKKLAGINTHLTNLSHVKDPAIKGIIAHKLQMARLQGIAIKVGALEDITEFNIEPFDLARVLGTLLDNAIEAAAEQPDPFIGVAFAPLEDHLTILVENTCTTEPIPIEHLAEEGFSTKGENRGHGLRYVEEVLSAYPNVMHYMRQKDNVFTQTLHIYTQEEQ